MASSSSIESVGVPQQMASSERNTQPSGSPRVLLCVPSLPEDKLFGLLADLATVFRRDEVLIASPDLEEPEDAPALPLTVFDGTRVRSDWVLTAGDYVAANQLAQQHGAPQVLLLGADICTLPATAIR